MQSVYLNFQRILAMIELSPYHETFFNEWKLNPTRSDYNIVFDNELHGDMNPDRMKHALLRLSQDFHLLHSKIEEINGKYYWVAEPDLRIRFEYFDHPLDDWELTAFVKLPFNLHKEVLLRIALIKLTTQRFRIVLVFHHLIMDSAKTDFVSDVLPRYYKGEEIGNLLPLQEQRVRLSQFSEKYLQSFRENESDHKNFWCELLKDLPSVDLEFLKPAEKANTVDEDVIGEKEFTLDSTALTLIRQAARKYTITPYLLTLSIFTVTLFRYTQQRRMGLCIPIAIPDGKEFIYGSNISPTVFFIDLHHASTVAEVIKAARQHLKHIKSGNHYHYPFQKLTATNISKDLFHTSFIQSNLKDIRINFDGTNRQIVNTDLNVDMAGKLVFAQEIKNDQFNFRVTFRKKYIDQELLSNFVNVYQRLLNEISLDLVRNEEEKSISQYRATEHAQELLFKKWSSTEKSYPNKTLHQLFEDQVERTPDATALIFKETSWSYAELNHHANRLAHYLRNSFSVQSDDIIGICLRPGHHIIVALWAVLKAGAAYLPIAESDPKDRIKFELNDSQTKIVITDTFCAGQLGHIFTQCQINVVNLDSYEITAEITAAGANAPADNLISSASPANLAYVIYTSGTLGTPKGVQIEHHGVVNYVIDLIEYNQLSASSVGAKFAAFSFDGSVMEIYPVLLSGGRLCIIEEDDRSDCAKVNDFFHQHGVTYAFLPTPFAELFFELSNHSLKTLMVGGSKLNKYVKTPYRIVNGYGPTEATVQATIGLVDKDYDNIPIGKPMHNVKCYVVNQYMEQVAVGVIGELLIGGDGVARGYLNLPELTAQRFITNPFQSSQKKRAHKNDRVYKTGDIVRWLPDGNLQYIGRNDNQVKIRGYRIELGEIEHRLLQHTSVRQVAVIATTLREKSATKQLIAYYVALSPVNAAQLKAYLLQYLPCYMVPGIFVPLEKMPLTTSGKIDRAILPLPIMSENQPQVVPGNLSEEIVCSEFAHVLGLAKQEISIHDDFFDLGGDSLAAIRLSYLLGRHLKLSVADIFALRTPAKIASNTPANGGTIIQKIDQLRLLYQNKLSFALNDWESRASSGVHKKFQQHIDHINQLEMDVSRRKEIRTVMLTGATGFLGCHLLKALLDETSYNIYLPVRDDSNQTAFERLNQHFQFYFSEDLHKNLNRLRVFSAVLDDKFLGVSPDEYSHLITQIDSIIHCAALVKYEGHAEEFRRSNIQPTINVLELARQTRTKDFHYISTIGVLLDGHIIDQDFVLFTEEDDLSNFSRGNHPYTQSKFQAEQHVLNYRLQGVQGSIYRIGNLTMNSQSHVIQKNIEDNMFFAHLKSLLHFKSMPKEISLIEASPVDCAASAIIKIFDKVSLSNQTYHIFNPTTCDLRMTLNYFENFRKSKCTLKEFVNDVIQRLESEGTTNRFLNLLMLYQLWLREIDSNHSTCIRVSQYKTAHVLTQMGFSWPKLTPAMFERMINASYRFSAEGV